MTLSLDELQHLYDSLPEDATLGDQPKTPIKTPHPYSIPKTFPAFDEITLLTFNAYDNGPDEKTSWVKARHAMNLQAFTNTSPFTPSSSAAAWEGTIQLHSCSLVGRYLTAKFPVEEEISRPMLKSTDDLDPDTHTDVRIGQLFSKRGGTRYAWGTMRRTSNDEFGELNAELLQGDQIIHDQGFTPVVDPRRPTLKFVGRYDPHGLWQWGKRKFTKAARS